MNEPGHNPGADALPRIGDEPLRLEFSVQGDIDLGAVLGAEAAPGKYLGSRNALLVALHLTAWENPERWTAYPRDRNAYAALRRYFGPAWSWKGLLWAVASLEDADLIEHRPTWPGPNRRYRSTLRSTGRLLSLSPVSHVKQLHRTVCEPLQLKDASGRRMVYRETTDTRIWRADIEEQNEALRGLDISPDPRTWTADAHGLLRRNGRVLNVARDQYHRVFNRDWRHGGRWYGPWWQGLGEGDRARMMIDGEAVVEIDYPSFHPTLLAALAGKPMLSGDPYAIDDIPRGLAKCAFNILVNAESEQSAVRAIQQELVVRGYRTSRWSPAQVVASLKKRHPDFANAWGTGIGLKLQAVDAGMCADVQRIMREAGHPVLSVHDSFIVGASRKDLLQTVMTEVLERVTSQLATNPSGFS